RAGERPAGGPALGGRCTRRLEREYAGVSGPDAAGRHAGRAAGHPLVDRDHGLLPDLLDRQPTRRSAVGEGDDRDPGDPTTARPRRLRAAAGLAAGENPPPRSQIPAQRTDPTGDGEAAAIAGVPALFAGEVHRVVRTLSLK